MFTESYTKELSDLRAGKSGYMEFIERAKCDKQYKKWCKEHALKPCEDNAELFFDMHGFEETEVVKEFIEPVL